MAQGKGTDIVADGFFALRTPLLPIEEFEAWSQGLDAPGAQPVDVAAALERDRKVLRDRLASVCARPRVREAIFLASPQLEALLDRWLEASETKQGRKIERALVRYFTRMCTRATPFGLFAGNGVGRLAQGTNLVVSGPSSLGRRTRLDMHYLTALAQRLLADPALRRELTYRPNSSLYRAGGRLRYTKADLSRSTRSYRLIAIEETDYLIATLQRSEGGSSFAELVGPLAVDGVSLEEANAFIERLIDEQILVSDLEPPVTGSESITVLIDRLHATPSGHRPAERLAGVRRSLALIDETGPGVETRAYRDVADALQELPADVELPRLFQVDMVRPCPDATVGAAVVDEVLRAIGALHAIGAGPTVDPFAAFRRQFLSRYETAEVPLTEVLDEEIGIGFEASRAPAAEASPLLRGVTFPAVEDEAPSWSRQQAYLLNRLTRALSAGEDELVLDDGDLRRLEVDEPPPLPDAFCVMAAIAAGCGADVDAGSFGLLFLGLGGPSGGRLLGRFCHADQDLRREVEAHLHAEEALRPDAVFAEIVHLPEGRTGNILARPVLRAYEIPFLGRSSAPPHMQIPITDLTVSVVADRVLLRSKSLDREVVPRLSSAHNYSRRGLGVYRFLCALQDQRVLPGLVWNWGPLESAAFLPRVLFGRTVLARARWLLVRSELERLRGDAFVEMQRLRRERDLPRLVVLADADNELVVDFDNVMSVDSFVQVVARRREARLLEAWPWRDELCAHGPEGRLVHELLIPFTRREERARPAPRQWRRTGVRRSFAPGSEWLYLKLFTGTATADVVLRSFVSPVVRELFEAGWIDRWFFVRYGDPEWHLRVRLHGEPATLHADVLPRLEEAVGGLEEAGGIWRFQLDTYVREVERYGGAEAIEIAEDVFHADSEAVVEMLSGLGGDRGLDLRWRLGLLGVDLLLADLGFDHEARAGIVRDMLASYRREFSVGAETRRTIGERYREEKAALAALLDPDQRRSGPMAPFAGALERRSARVSDAAARLARLEEQGRLDASLESIGASFAHLHLNRLLRSAHRAQELVIYDLLDRLYRARAARS